MEGKKFPKTFFEVLERQNMKNQTIFELYTDDKKSKYSSNPMNILKSSKKKYETLYQVHFHSCYYWFFLENSYEHFNLSEAEISLDEIIKQRHA